MMETVLTTGARRRANCKVVQSSSQIVTTSKLTPSGFPAGCIIIIIIIIVIITLNLYSAYYRKK